MRITSNMTADNSIYNIQKAQTSLGKLQEQLSSGQNINRPSDDPTATNTFLNLRDEINNIDQYSDSITKATTSLNVANNSITGISDIMQQAKDLVATLTDGNNDASTRQSANDQLVMLKKQVIDYANTQSGDTYVFAGSNNMSAPFNAANNSYAGNSDQLSVQITTNSTQEVNITGDRLLKGSGTNPSYGSTDILGTFDNLISAVGDSNTASNATALQQGAKDLEAGSTQINNAQIDVASRLKRLDSISTMNTNNKNTLENTIGSIQNIDTAALGVELTQQETAYEATLSSTSKIIQKSLLDYLT